MVGGELTSFEGGGYYFRDFGGLLVSEGRYFGKFTVVNLIDGNQ